MGAANQGALSDVLEAANELSGRSSSSLCLGASFKDWPHPSDPLLFVHPTLSLIPNT